MQKSTECLYIFSFFSPLSFIEPPPTHHNSIWIYTTYYIFIMLCLRDHHSRQFHHGEFKLSFIYRMFSWIVILKLVLFHCFLLQRNSNYSYNGSSLPFFYFNHFLSFYFFLHITNNSHHCFPAFFQWCILYFHSNLFFW